MLFPVVFDAINPRIRLVATNNDPNHDIMFVNERVVGHVTHLRLVELCAFLEFPKTRRCQDLRSVSQCTNAQIAEVQEGRISRLRPPLVLRKVARIGPQPRPVDA